MGHSGYCTVKFEMIGFQSDTTSTAIQSTVLAMTLNPRVYQNLKSKIEAAAVAKRTTHPIRDLEVKQLHHLRAYIPKGLRRFPQLSQLRKRMVPQEGDLINAYRIPCGTFICLNA
ncbi:hypothetical protein BDR22DRAFT_145043 [Usnea florida]